MLADSEVQDILRDQEALENPFTRFATGYLPPNIDADQIVIRDCYLHGYVSAGIMNQARKSENGLAVTIGATKVDGIVLSLTPNSHSYNYRSAVLFGHGSFVDVGTLSNRFPPSF